jgi:hypothetical protein
LSLAIEVDLTMRTYLIAGLALIVLPLPCFADEAEQLTDPKVLYNDAIRAMDAGDHAKACPMLERVTQVLPDGLGAKFTLAECFEEQGQLLKAYTTFVAVEKAAIEKGQTERKQRAAARAKALRPRLGQISFTGPQSLASGYDLRIEMDGVTIESTDLDEPRYVDAGTHHLVVFVKGMRRSETDVDVEAGAVKEVSIRALMNLPRREEAPRQQSPVQVTPTPITKAEPVTPKPLPKRSFPVWQVIVGGVGLAAVGAGIAFKLDSTVAEDRLVEQCGEALQCSRQAAYDPAADNAQKNRSFGLFVGLTGAGAIALGTATLGLILRRPEPQAPKSAVTVQPTISPAHGGVVFSGRF